MGKYVLRRLLVAIPTFIGITVLVFFLSYLAPGSPLEMLFMDSNADAQVMADMEARLGLDQPVYIQYFRWVGQLFQDGCGEDRTYVTDYDCITDSLRTDCNPSWSHVGI